MRKLLFLLAAISIIFSSCVNKSSGSVNDRSEKSIQAKKFKVIAYWTGSDSIAAQKIQQLDQIIYSFLHLEENSLKVTERDSIRLDYLKKQKQINSELKVLISLGGWGGCETCSDVFSTEKGRKDFAASVAKIIEDYDADGIDLDWEYPAIQGFEGHSYKTEDRENFTFLVQELRDVLGQNAVISFAAGGFKKFLDNSVQWKKVMPLVDHVNLMTYDMVNGGSPHTGHHTSLYSTGNQKNSAEETIKYLDSIGVSSEKMILGAAFYGRVWEEVHDSLNGLYQKGKFKESVLFKDLGKYKADHPGFKDFWDSKAESPYLYNAEKKLFVTYDDSLSISKKTTYVIDHKLGGIMFWRLSGDEENGLLEAISREKEKLKD